MSSSEMKLLKKSAGELSANFPSFGNSFSRKKFSFFVMERHLEIFLSILLVVYILFASFSLRFSPQHNAAAVPDNAIYSYPGLIYLAELPRRKSTVCAVFFLLMRKMTKN
jgi:hypothetical protein